MKNLLGLTVLLLFASVFYFTGCGDAPPDIVAPKSEKTRMQVEAGAAKPIATEPIATEPIATEPTRAERTFARLRNQFPQPIVDEDFTLLRKVVNSDTYLAFLTAEFPTDEPFQTFEAYLEEAPPDEERYLPFLKKWVGNPTPEDVEVIQWMTGKYREMNLHLFRVKFRQGVVQVGDVFREVGQVFEKLAVMAENPRVEAFMTRHALQDNDFGQAFDEAQGDFEQAFEDFVAATEREDAGWLHEQFEAQNGIDEGLLWAALRKPALIGDILQHFSSTDVFLKWVEVTKAV